MRILLAILAINLLLSCRGPQLEMRPSATTEMQTTLNIGAWNLAKESSVVSFITTKNFNISEVHNFKLFSGFIDDSGNAVVTIDLESVETNIDIRNQRMRDHLFETKLHRQASINAQLDFSSLYSMKQGSRTSKTIKLMVGLHGMVKIIETEVFITRSARKTVIVESRSPILIHAEDFGLLGGITKLQNLAKLSSITPVVPVSFSLVFEAK